MLFVTVLLAGVSMSRHVRGEASGRQESLLKWYPTLKTHLHHLRGPAFLCDRTVRTRTDAETPRGGPLLQLSQVSTFALFTKRYYFKTDDNAHLGQLLRL